MKHSLFALGVILSAGCRGREAPADLVIEHAAGYTLEPTQPSAQAVAIRGARIVYVGTDSGVRGWIGAKTEVIDGRGGTLLPGFVDSHVHPVSGLELMECDLNDDSTRAQALESIRRCAAERPHAKWIRGTGWQLPLFPKGNPQAAELDQVVADRPAYITAADGHSAWVNTKALHLAGLTRATRDPPNGRIERDRTGAPSGALRESAMDLVARLLPAYTTADYVAGFERAQVMANRFGITSIIEADADSAMLVAYHQMDSTAGLTMRVTAAQQVDLSRGPGQVQRLIGLRNRYRGRLFEPTSAKIFADGVIEAGTAALLAPYLDRPGNAGTPNLTPLAMDSLVGALDRAGFQVHVHAIGDRAIRMSLDAFQHARAANGVRDSRHIIAHLELIDPRDIPRFKALGVIADFQPLWAFADPYITDLTEPVLGPVRSRWLYPIASVLQTGATVVGGSDWSVSSMNPLEAIQVGITRRGPDSGPGEAWIPEERVSLPAMLAAYTINGAYARFADSLTGSLKVGKAADLVLLDRDLLAAPVDSIARTLVVATIFDGRVVYHR